MQGKKKMTWFENINTAGIIIIGVVLVILVVGIIFMRGRIKRKKEKRVHKANAYVNALNELIAGNSQKAIELFKEAVRFDTNNIDAYIKLGMLYRRESNTSQAFKIHRDLTIRSGLKTSQLIEIYYNIISDLVDMKNFDEALTYCDKLLSVDPNNRWALDIQPEIYAQKKDFKNAFKYLKENAEKSGEIDHQLALYKIAHGKVLMERGEFHDARILFKEAIKLDPMYPAAYLYLGDAYAREENRDDAVKVWREFAETVPQKSYLVFDYLDSAYFEAGNYGAMEVFYSTIIEKDSDNYRALFRLGEIYFKKGEKEKALEMTERGLRINQNASEGLKNLILYLDNTSDIQLIKEKAISLAELVTDSATYVCKFCGYSTLEICIQCPECEKWDAFEF